MHIELTPEEARVIGCLIEKQICTPEQYPLSLNALTNACNQKSNRDPVVDWSDSEVQAVLDGLRRKHQVSEQSGHGSRVPKYEHRFCNTSYGQLRLSPQELAVLCELFLRGPQTPGELRSRASRMAPFAEAGEVEAVLDALMARESGALVVRLAREPGKRESRYAHLFCGEVAGALLAGASDEADMPASGSKASRLDELEARVAKLEAELAALKAQLGAD
jgi:uncharacterized protein YceH (UPF0502 family)